MLEEGLEKVGYKIDEDRLDEFPAKEAAQGLFKMIQMGRSTIHEQLFKAI